MMIERILILLLSIYGFECYVHLPYFVKPARYLSTAIKRSMTHGPQQILPTATFGHINENLNSTIFCNVELNCANLEAVGFDMDYTLAQYNEEFDKLAFEGAKKKLIENLGYPEQIMDFEYSADKFRRGLIIDKRRGNIIKIDRHKYVRKVYHGLEEVTAAIRKSIYSQQVASFTESHYANIDTMFLLVDAVLFTHLVDFRDRHPDLIPKSYEEIYSDIRRSVDLCHRDGTIKDTVVQDPGKYIVFDEGTVPMLKQLRQAGKKVFLLTNSLWDYTNIVMDYLVHGQGGIGNNPEVKWEELFDLIVVGGNKPAFLKEDYLSIFRVDSAGQLHNIEDKDSIHRDLLQQQKIFHGGCWQDLHRLLGISTGDRILYVGDHMYADILRSKRSLGWRTCLIIPELEHELAVARRESASAKEILKLRKLQTDLDEYIDYLRLKIRVGVADLDHQLQEAETKAIELKAKLRDVTEEYNSKFNVFWGQLLKAGHQDSRFGNQVVNYACLYTSRVSNLGLVSPNRPFRPVQDFMPHDQALSDDLAGKNREEEHHLATTSPNHSLREE